MDFVWKLCESEVKVKVKSLSRVQLFATPWTVAYQAPLSMGFSRQEYWSKMPFPHLSKLTECTAARVILKGSYGVRMIMCQCRFSRFLGEDDPLEEEMAIYSSILAWEIPWTEESGRPESMQSQRVRHDLATKQQRIYV